MPQRVQTYVSQASTACDTCKRLSRVRRLSRRANFESRTPSHHGLAKAARQAQQADQPPGLPDAAVASPRPAKAGSMIWSSGARRTAAR